MHLCTAVRICPNIYDMDWRDRSFCSPCSYLAMRQYVSHREKVKKLTLDTQMISGVH